MAKWGKVDIRELKQFQKNLEKMQADADKINTAILKELATRTLRKVISRTPVITGELRRNWTVGSVTKNGGHYEIIIFNPVEYAQYVEYGHRQTPGRYVPAIGKRLKESWVQGRFMLKISCDEMQRLAPSIIEKRLKKELEGLFDVK